MILRSLLDHCCSPEALSAIEAGTIADNVLWQMSEAEAARSRFSYNLFMSDDIHTMSRTELSCSIPRIIVQYWDTDTVPDDVKGAMASWRNLDGWDYALFSDSSASALISERYGNEFRRYYEYCHHPAMRSDYFRLAFLIAHGGFYVDADDVCLSEFDLCFGQLHGGLYVCPYVWDPTAARTVPWAEFNMRPEFSSSLRYYFANAPLSAYRNNEVLITTFQRASERIHAAMRRGQQGNIHSDTGPEMLTASVLYSVLKSLNSKESQLLDIRLLRQIDRMMSTGYFHYKADERNWRRGVRLYGGSTMET